ncbi:TAXI family TRAP transporter solute-binding subunit [Sulfitobacter sp. F26204]|uniref:TAXI family TRAP transporter solute-binding subunit n=1 Tax=Sulfitobacter sp. F26204 TaxID=2996014 RepID=UPI00225DE19E|nr:TAXI family TRAP transporter solute-binding subunit [Sulfitobacter sp. F26204]MCX7560636.1 TAXI family TRAP transporter solute-binding subunit [Sulfitobacter sp. F26204]
MHYRQNRITSFAAASLLAFALPVQAEQMNVTLAGASPGGLWTLLGAGLESALKVDEDGSSVTYQTSGGGFANAMLVSSARAELGLIHDAELKIAVAGGAPFKGPIENLRTISYLYDWAPMQFIATNQWAEENGVQSLADIAANEVPVTITINRAGNITGEVAAAMLEAVGANPEKIEAWGGAVIRAGSKEQADLLTNGRVDMFSNGVFVGHSSIRQIENAIDMRLINVPEDVRNTVGKEFSIAEFTIPAGTYENQPDDIQTLALGAVLVVSADMSEDQAYTLTKAMIDNIDSIRSVHPAMKALSTALMIRETAAPHHPGALKAYREAGLIE